MVTVPCKMARVERMSDCRGAGLQRFQCTKEVFYSFLNIPSHKSKYEIIEMPTVPTITGPSLVAS